MGSAETFIDKVDDMLLTLGLPPVWEIEEIDDLEAYEEEISGLQLVFCFPNLTAEERNLVGFAAHVNRRVRFLSTALAAGEMHTSTRLRQKTEDALSSARQTHREAVDSVEEYGLRAKLTEFQEQILAHFLHGETADQKPSHDHP